MFLIRLCILLKWKRYFTVGMTGKTDHHQGESCKDRKYSNTIVSKTMDHSYNIFVSSIGWNFCCKKLNTDKRIGKLMTHSLWK